MTDADLLAMIHRLEGDERRLVEVFVSRLEMGRSQYGVWLAHTERRDLRREQAEEGVDFLVYAIMRSTAKLLAKEES